MKENKVVITKVFWKRTYLFFEYNADKKVDFSFMKIKKSKKNPTDYKIIKTVPLESKELAPGLYRAKINMVIAEGRNLLSSGTWHIVFDNNFDNKPEISEDVLFCIEDITRTFTYCSNFYAYVVNFTLNKDDFHENLENFYLTMNVRIYRKYFKEFKRTFAEVLFFNGFGDFLRKIAVRLGKFLLNLYYQIVTHLCFHNGKRVLIMSENREKIMDNLLAIDNRLKERGLDKEFKISYSFRNIFKYKHQKLFQWLKVINLIAKQDYIFVDDYVPIFTLLNLNKKTTLVQTWHAGFGFKLVGYGRFGIAGSPHANNSCHRKYTYGLVGNNNLKEIYSEVWGIDKESLLATGMPRLEHFLDKDVQEEKRKFFYDKYPQFKGKKVINFAPTYRGYNQFEAYYDYDQLDFDRLAEYCKKNNCVFIFGKHHFIKNEIPIKEKHKKYLYDFSKYSLNDTFYITDILITDYSSCFYDFLLLKKPVIFFCYDKAIYSSTRGVHRPIDKVAPGIVANNFDELMTALDQCSNEKFEVKDFLIDKCLTNKMLASDQVIDYVLLHKDVDGI